MAINLSKGYNPPNRNIKYKDLLGVIHDQNMKSKLTMINKEADFFGLIFLGDGATISRSPLLNFLAFGKKFQYQL